MNDQIARDRHLAQTDPRESIRQGLLSVTPAVALALVEKSTREAAEWL